MSANFGVLVGLMMTWFSETILISNKFIGGVMPNLLKKSWMVSNLHVHVHIGPGTNSKTLIWLNLGAFVWVYYAYTRCIMPQEVVHTATQHTTGWNDLPYARHFNPRFVYFLPTFWSWKTFFQGAFFLKFWPYVWLIFKSGF